MFWRRLSTGESNQKSACSTYQLEQLQKLAQDTYVPAIALGMIYFGLGDIDKSFNWLEKVVEEHDSMRLFLNSPFLDPLRPDPRYNALLRKMNLEA
jgi:hypothetical protein